MYARLLRFSILFTQTICKRCAVFLTSDPLFVLSSVHEHLTFINIFTLSNTHWSEMEMDAYNRSNK